MKAYWDSLTKEQQGELAGKVGSTPGYLRLVFNGYKKASFVLAKKLEQCTSGAITKSDLRPDSDSSGVDYSPIAAGFKGLLPYTSKARQACSDNDALIIESCLEQLKKRKPYEHSLLVAHYLYGFSKRKIAKVQGKDEKLIRIEILLAEGFIDGCLSTLDIHLDMEL